MTVLVQKWGNSQGIRLPKNFLQAIKWKENQKLDLQVEDDKIIIKAIQDDKRKTIQELFADYHEEYTPTEFDWGEAVGNEIW